MIVALCYVSYIFSKQDDSWTGKDTNNYTVNEHKPQHSCYEKQKMNKEQKNYCL